MGTRDLVCNHVLSFKYVVNVMELSIESDKHFIYWEDINDLRNKIKHITENYDKYQHIIDAAYDKVMEYEVKEIFKKIKND